MNFGTPALGRSPARWRRGGASPEKLYDCGRHGQLSAGQIARMAGISDTAVYKRIDAGWAGEDLCAPRWAKQPDLREEGPLPPQRHILVAAFYFAARFPDREPTPEEIQEYRPMSLANAQLWRRAIAHARREARRQSGEGS